MVTHSPPQIYVYGKKSFRIGKDWADALEGSLPVLPESGLCLPGFDLLP